jgi:hypothetical protein
MSARIREPYAFQVGEKAIVVSEGKTVGEGTITKVTPMLVVFFEPKANFSFAYKRKADRWVEMRKDQYELLPAL